MSRLLSAMTPPGLDFPPFINATEQADGTVRVTVRAIAIREPYSALVVAKAAHIDLTREQAVEFACDFLRELANRPIQQGDRVRMRVGSPAQPGVVLAVGTDFVWVLFDEQCQPQTIATERLTHAAETRS